AGTESMTLIPIGGRRVSPTPTLVEEHPASYLTMGLTAENVARDYHISRDDQDNFALQSHRRALAAIDAGRFKDEIVPLPIREVALENGNKVVRQFTFDTDEGPRRDTSKQALQK